MQQSLLRISYNRWETQPVVLIAKFIATYKYIRISTWTKMQNLYDHLGDQLKVDYSFSTKKETILLKYFDQWLSLTSMKQLSNLNKDAIQYYFDVSKEDNRYSMFNCIKLNNGLGEETIWKVIEDKDVFRINDVVKLGRYRYKLIDMITTPAETESQQQIETQNTCKICYQKTESPSNPLLSPCNCSGTMKHIHLQCLRHWVAKTCNIKQTQYVAQIPTKQIKCQLCGKLYQAIIQHKQKNYCILYDNTTIKPPYIHLNLLQKNSNHCKISYIISFKNRQIIRIGRANNCQIQPKQDISVSRIHSELILKDNVLFIRNCNSKFGTLKLLVEPQQIIIMPITKKYQIANNLIQVQSKQAQNNGILQEESPAQTNQFRSIRESLATQPRAYQNRIPYTLQPIMTSSIQL